MTVELKPAYNTGNEEKDKALSVANYTPYLKVGGADGYRPGTVIPHVGGSTLLQNAERFKGVVKAEIVSYGKTDFKQLTPTVEIDTQNLPQLNNLVATIKTGNVPAMPPMQEQVQPQPVIEQQQPSQTLAVSPQQLTDLMSTMLAQVMGKAAAEQPAPPQLPPPMPVPMPAPVPMPQVRQPAPFVGAVPRPSFPPVDAASDAFRSLGIPNLSVTPAPPRTRVDFATDPNRSQIIFSHTAYYHWVAVAGSVLLLIADSRFDYPYWAPNDMGDNVFHVTVIGSEGQQPQVYDCRLCGAEFRFGNFRFFMLLVVPPMENY